MTMENEMGSMATDLAGRSGSADPSRGPTTPKSDAKAVASAAADETAAVAHTAVDAGRDVAHETRAQVSEVASQAKQQLTNVVGQAKSELKTQVDARGQQAASGLQSLSDQLTALAQGRPDEAGQVTALLGDAQQRIQAYAQTLQEHGPQAVIEDLTAFARRKPGTFLLGAALTGFAIGRIVRAGAAANKESSDNGSDYSGGQGSIPMRSATMVGLGYQSTGYSSLPEGESGFAGTPLPPPVGSEPHLTGLAGTPFTPADLAGDGYEPNEQVNTRSQTLGAP